MLLRHGRTADNLAGRTQGQLDTPLDAVGRRQAELAAPAVAALGPSLLLTSDLSRARATAAPLAAVTRLEARPDPRLRELDLGAWQGLTVEEARDRFPEEHDAWRSGADVSRGGGETYRQAGERAVAALEQGLRDVPPGGVLVAVTHGGTARGALCLLLDVAAEQWWRLGALDNTGWTVLVEHRNGWRLERHNAGVGAYEGAPAGGTPAEPVRY